jgi:hypothetical protein
MRPDCAKNLQAERREDFPAKKRPLFSSPLFMYGSAHGNGRVEATSWTARSIATRLARQAAPLGSSREAKLPSRLNFALSEI